MVKSFSRGVTFNTHTCKLERSDNGRIIVKHDMRRRCDLALNSVIRHTNSKKRASAASVLSDMQSRFSDSYQLGDIRSALTKLRNVGVLECFGGAYTLTDIGKEVWKQFKEAAKAK